MHDGPWPSSAKASHVKPRPSTALLCLPSCPSALSGAIQVGATQAQHWIGCCCRAAAGSKDCGEVTELNTNRDGTERHRFSTDLGFVPPCRSFGGGSPIPQQLSKNREILKSERAGAADVAANVVQSQSQCIQRDCGGSRRVRR
jgi:hypothetical protein